jgi:hypothetical protein
VCSPFGEVLAADFVPPQVLAAQKAASKADCCETQPRTATPPSRKPYYQNNPTNDGGCGVTAITDRPFVLVILGQTLVSMGHAR